MLADDRLTRITGPIRAVGILVVLLVAFTGSPQGMWGEEGGGECTDYFIDFCIADHQCALDDGEVCGEHIPGCAGKGKIKCELTSNPNCQENEVKKLCLFEGGAYH